MLCEHPACVFQGNTICKHHCHLTVCQEHQLEHETTLLNEVEKQLDDLSTPVSTLLNQSRCALQKSEESHQHELDRIKSLYDHHLSTMDQRLKLSNTANELVSSMREQLIKCKNGDDQLTREDHQRIQNLSNQIESHLHEQYQLNNYMSNKCASVDLWTGDKENHASKEIECIQLSDSEDDIVQSSTDIVNVDQSEETMDASPSSSSKNIEITPTDIRNKTKLNSSLIRDYCPLTHLGVFGLNSSHNVRRLCSKETNTKRYLYIHFLRTHCIKSPIAYQLVKAIRDGCDPTKTKIFPQDNTSVLIEHMSCPFNDTATEFNDEHSIPNTPCHSSLIYYNFKSHLRSIHSITKTNVELIYNAMRSHGSISHVQFEEDLCENT